MTDLTRRHFFQISGIALLGSQLRPAFALAETFNRDAPLYGRALDILSVRNAAGKLLSRLFPDSIVRLLDAREDVFRVPGGYIERGGVQPMMPSRPVPANPPALPFWAEVLSPSAAVRRSCAADAPLVTRIGHGGVARVGHVLLDGRGGQDWYEIETGDGLTGWTQATHWRPVESSGDPVPLDRLQIDLQAQQLTAVRDDEAVLRVPVSVSPHLSPGVYAITERRMTGQYTDAGGTYYGAPWQLALEGGALITGVYWHNRFGAPVEGDGIHVTPLAARWLHDSRDAPAQVTIS